MLTYLPVGKFVATHGLNGELVLQHTLGKRSNLAGIKALFIEEKKGQFIPWFIEKTKIRTAEETLVKLEGVDTKEKAQKLSRQPVWLSEIDFDKNVSKRAPVKLLGYHIHEAGEDLGEILELIEQPHQLLCRLQIQGKDVFIPLHEESLERVDHKLKIVQVNLPEGLLDIYLT